MTDLDAHITRVVDAAPPLTGEQVDRLVILLNARTAGAANPDRSKTEPDVARTEKGTPRSEVGRAA